MTTTSEVLNRAADLIEERGWATGVTGWRVGGRLCLEGGIIAAIGGATAADQPLAWACPAYAAVGDYLGRPALSVCGDRELWKWNDRPERTASEVVEVLRACAVIEASRERETAEVSS